MAGLGKQAHEETVGKTLAMLRQLGCKAVSLDGMCPNGVAATPDGHLFAFEVLTTEYAGKGDFSLKKSSRYDKKKRAYQALGFDGVLIVQHTPQEKYFDKIAEALAELAGQNRANQEYWIYERHAKELGFTLNDRLPVGVFA